MDRSDKDDNEEIEREGGGDLDHITGPLNNYPIIRFPTIRILPDNGPHGRC